MSLMHGANMKNQFLFTFVQKHLKLKACATFLPSPSGCALVFRKRVKHDNRHASRKPFCRNWLDTICKRILLRAEHITSVCVTSASQSCAENSGLLNCNPVSLGKYFPTLRLIVMPYFQGQTIKKW